MAITRPAPVPHEQRWPLARDGVAVVAVGLGLFLMVLLVLPAEGLVARPLRDWLWHLFGQAAFVVPIAMLLGGVVVLARTLAPDARLPYSRMVGLSTLALASLPVQHLIASESAGLAGHGMARLLLDLIGQPATVFVLAVTLLVGVVLTFDVRRWGRHAES
jgi:4TM region of DNA translocase FtsK/SpoIIIE